MRGTDRPRVSRWKRLGATAATCLGVGLTAVLVGCGDDSTDKSAADTTAATDTAASKSDCWKPSGRPVRIGYIYSATGFLAPYGRPQPDAVNVEVDKINCVGGVNGRPLKVNYADHHSDPDKTRTEAERLVASGVDALIVNADSASREAAIPVTEKSHTLLLYPTQFEGRACGSSAVFTGEVPNQQLEQPIEYLMEQTGGTKWYIIGSDYVYPQVSTKLATQYIEAAGGEVAGEELVPLGTTDFSSSIQKISDAQPEMLLSILVGADAIAFEQQAADFGVGQAELPRLSPVYDESVVGEVGPDLLEGMLTSFSFYENADVPETQKFVKEYDAEAGSGAPRPNTYAAHGNLTVQMWAEAANEAGTTDTKPVLDKLLGMSADTVIGKVTLERNHYLTQPVYIGKADSDGKFQVVKTYDAVKPEEECSG